MNDILILYHLQHSEKFGQEGIDVEEGKKENRSLATFHFKLQDFISRYKDEDIYLVETLPAKMRGTVLTIFKVWQADDSLAVRP